MLFDEILEVVDTEPHGAALNMALDEALLGRLSGPAIRIYQWQAPAVTIGYFGKSVEAAAKWPEREMARRWTGGGIVLHGEDITFSLLVPTGHPFAAEKPGATYRKIHECVAQWLATTGMAAALADDRPKVSDECFASPVQHDVLADGQKVSGGAQRRSRLGMLHQGSIQPISAAARARRHTLASAFGRSIIPHPLSAEDLQEAKRLVTTKYGSDAWTRRW